MISTPTPATTLPNLDLQAGGHAAQPLADTQKAAASKHQEQQHTRNAQVLEASMHVSIHAGHDSLALLYRTALDEINGALEAELGPNAIQNASMQDNSPEATAGRIVSLSLALFDSFAARYPEKDLAQVAQDFVHVIRGGFEQGYQEAQEILNSLGVLPEATEIAQGLAKTFELVQKGYDDWLHHRLASARTDSPEIPNDAAATQTA